MAPTPSGYLHEGNCVNFVLTAWLARQSGGLLALRIDDMDADRYRPEFVDDVFRVLRWLGITWDRGPVNREDFEASFSLRGRTEAYRAALPLLSSHGSGVYACECSRAELRASGGGACVRQCRERDVALEPGVSALRVHVPSGTRVPVGSMSVDLHREMGDFVVWRSDDRPAYQLASVIEDRDLGTTHFVRGRDLRASSAAQVYLAPALSATKVHDGVFIHHELVRGEDGAKLSKSTLTTGPLPESDALLREIHRRAIELGGQVGISPAS